MGYVVNPSLNYVNVPESSVYQLFRSIVAVQMPDAHFRSRVCEANICLVKEDKCLKGYVALFDSEKKIVTIYTSDFSTTDSAEFPKVYDEAEAFLKDFGFKLEPINLNFSPAMREVIIRGVSCMKPPQMKKAAQRTLRGHGTVAPHTEDLPTTRVTALVDSPVEDISTEIESLRFELNSAKSVIQKLTSEKVEREKSAAQQIASLKSLCEQEVEARRTAAEEYAHEVEALRRLTDSSTVLLDDREHYLNNEIESVIAARNLAEEEIASLKERNGRLSLELKTGIQRSAQIEKSLEEKLKILFDEKNSLQIRLDEGDKALFTANQKITVLEQYEVSWRESQHREEELCRNIDLMQWEIDKITAELQEQKLREAIHEEQVTKTEYLKSELVLLRQELVVKETFDAAIPELEREIAELKGQKQAIEDEYVRLANESRSNEVELNDALASADAEIQRLSMEMETNTQVAELEHSALRAELRRIIVSGGVVSQASPVAAPAQRVQLEAVRYVSGAALAPVAVEAAAIPQPPAQVAVPAPPAEAVKFSVPIAIADEGGELVEHEDTEPDRALICDKELTVSLINEFGGFIGSNSESSTEFTVDKNLHYLEYGAPEEVVALIHSTNSVQAVPDNSKSQRCKAFVVATLIDGRYSVYAIWQLTESKKVVICTPGVQPADRDECLITLQDAVTYFEIVGFMMEVTELGDTVRSYNLNLKKVSALKRLGG